AHTHRKTNMKNLTSLAMALLILGFITAAPIFAHEGEDHNQQGQSPQHDEHGNQGQGNEQHQDGDQHNQQKHKKQHKKHQDQKKNDGHSHQH
ncbi:MAG: hypothetical protein K2X77_10635, partial [Candidatus Obscuribacterales bacterium]|nr:hypothetical protein [Candidatus Obscuribacterales bacterium]